MRRRPPAGFDGTPAQWDALETELRDHIRDEIIRDYLTSPATEKALAEALVPDSTPEWRATEAKRLLAALVADADRRAVE